MEGLSRSRFGPEASSLSREAERLQQIERYPGMENDTTPYGISGERQPLLPSRLSIP